MGGVEGGSHDQQCSCSGVGVGEDLIGLKMANFQHLCDKRRHFVTILSLLNLLLPDYHWQTFGGGGEGGGKLSCQGELLPPPQ